jgi:excisionase family DNA binding protein
MEKLVYTIQEVADMLGLCNETVRKATADGRLGCIRISKRCVRIPREALQKFMGEREDK